MKRLISILLTLTMVLSLVCGMGVSAFAAEDAPEAAVEVVEEAPEATAAEEAPAAADADEAPEAVIEDDPSTVAPPPGDPPGPPPEGDPGDNPPPEDEQDPPADEGGESAGGTFVQANGFVTGQSYIIGIQKADGFYAVSYDGSKIVALKTDVAAPDASVIWQSVQSGRDSGSTNLKNGSVYLYYDSGKGILTTTTDSSKAQWNFSGDNFYYNGAGKANVGDVMADGQFAYGGDAAAFALYTNGEAGEGGSGGDDQPSAPPDEGGDSEEGSGFNQKTAPFDGDGVTAVFLTEDFRPLMFRGGALVVESTPLEVTGEAGSYHVESAPPPNQFKVWAAGPFMTLAADDRGSRVFIYVDGNGALQIAAGGDDGTIQHWQKDTGPGSTACVLGYTVDGTTYYAKIVDDTVTFVADAGQASTIYTLVGSGTSEGGPGGPGGGSSIPATDAAGPQIVAQPETAPVAIIGSGYAAPEYTVKVTLPEGSEAEKVYFQWYIDDKASELKEYEAAGTGDGVVYADTLVAESLKGLKTAGVHSVYVETYCNAVDGETGETVTHTNTSITVNFIVAKGVEANSFITFSDVHQTFDNIGAAINDIITTHGGLVPALIICTGDWSNGATSTYDETLNTYLPRLFAQVGGIDVVFVSGNHDNGQATAEYTNDAKLGGENFDGIGVIYDSSKKTNAGTTKDTEGLIVFGINYDSLSVGGGYSYASVLPKLESFLKGLKADNYDGLVVISAHAGLHKLDGWGGDAEYNVDRSDEVVALLNEYGQFLDIMFFFGHDHSKGESELVLKPGDKIESTVSFADKTTATQTLRFFYGHAGYITNDIGGQERYSYVTWDADTISRIMYVANNGGTVSDMSYTADRGAGSDVSDEPAAPEAGTGWVLNGCYWYYYKNGKMVTSDWVKPASKWYYLGEDGKMVADDWVKTNGKWYYLGSTGAMATSKWVKTDGIWYYVNSSGKMVTNTWVKSSGKWYYLGSNGAMATSQWVGRYWVNVNGVWTTSR